MKHTAVICILNFPSPITGDVYPTEIVNEVVKRYQKRIDSRLLVGCFFDNKDVLYTALGSSKSQSKIDRLKRDIIYYKSKINHISHIITDLYIDEDRWIAEIETIPTGKGLKLSALLEQEASIPFRPVVSKNKVDGVVKRIEELISIDCYQE